MLVFKYLFTFLKVGCSIDLVLICLSMENVAASDGHKVLVEVDDNKALPLDNPCVISGLHLRPHRFHLINIIIVKLVTYNLFWLFIIKLTTYPSRDADVLA
jgi:hypothetical protein